jgi:hypothetical protein
MPKSKMPTPNGERMRVSQLNLGAEPIEGKGHNNRFSRVYHSISLFLAGMYTGIKCGGTPNKYHNYDREKDDGPL